MESGYTPPLGLTIISSISIGIAALVALWIMLDIIWRRGWRTMMAIMIPVYIINALYLWPITLWTYLKFGRPQKPGGKGKETADGGHVPDQGEEIGVGGDHGHDHDHGGHSHVVSSADTASVPGEKVNEGETRQDMHAHHGHENQEAMMHSMPAADPESHHQHQHQHQAPQHHGEHPQEHDQGNPAEEPKEPGEPAVVTAGGGHNMHAHMHGGGDLPMFANVTIAVCHCGAGCVLGDLIGEWIVYGTGVTINGQSLWVEWLIDFVLALFFGIFFQYFSIAPATGEYGLKTIWRATTADFLSLVAFEIGLFGWMAIFQLAAFRSMLAMNTVTYWFMMQIGMFLGHWTAVPVNWWLLTSNIKVSIH